MEELQPTNRVHATAAPGRRAGLAETVPLDASQSADGTPTRVSDPIGLLLARELVPGRTAELPAGDRG